MTDGTGGHANRAEQIGRVTVVMARCLPVVGRGNRSNRGETMPEVLAADGMDVSKRQAEIDGERNQRKPRTAPDMVTKPTHYGRASFSEDPSPATAF